MSGKPGEASFTYELPNEYDKLVKEDPEFKNLAEQCNVTPPLIPHQAFKGGRTNVFRLLYEVKENGSGLLGNLRNKR